MKKSQFLGIVSVTLLAFLAIASPGFSQDKRVEINPFFGYSFSDGVTVDPIAIGGSAKRPVRSGSERQRRPLRQYTWKTRTEIKMKEESKSVKLEQVRYDLDGKLEKTPIDGAPAPAAKEEAGGRGRRGGGKLKEKVIEKKKDEFAELLQSLGQLVGSYAHMPPDKMQAFAANATMTPKQGDAQDQLLIQRKIS